MKYTTVLLIALPALILLTNTGTAQQVRGPARSMVAVRTDIPPVIDGKLDDACWSLANVATNFTDYRIEQPAKEQTQLPGALISTVTYRVVFGYRE